MGPLTHIEALDLDQVPKHLQDAVIVTVVIPASALITIVVMHMLGEPHTMQDKPHYEDVVVEVGGYLVAQAAILEVAGVSRDRIALDPGIGFGKTLEHNIELLQRLPELAALGYPLVVGLSRKRFVGAITGVDEPAERSEPSP